MAGWSEWARFRPENIRLIHPQETGVYECARGNRIVYIGRGVLRDRLLRHTVEVPFMDVTRFHIRKTDAGEAKRAEQRLLAEFEKEHGCLPEINKVMPSKPDSLEKYLYG